MNNIVRNAKGQWQEGQTGNPQGRPKRPEIEELRNAIKQVEQEKKEKLLAHFVRRAYKNDIVLIALIKKFVPDKTQADIDLSGGLDVIIRYADEKKSRSSIKS